MSDFQLNYTNVDGKFATIFLPMFVGGFAAFGFWLLYWLVVDPPSVPAGVVLAAVVLTTLTWLFSWLTLRSAVISWRIGRGAWWLRLSNSGFEVNDRIFRPRRYRWCDIEKFMLVAPSSQIEEAVLAPAVSFADAAPAWEDQPASFRVGFALAGARRRSVRRKFLDDLSGTDGTKADGTVVGFWDRPFDEAVALMNDWRRRHPYS